MANPIPIALAVEGTLDELVLRKIVDASGPRLKGVVCYGKKGKQYLREKFQGYRNASEKGGLPFIVLVDWDAVECAPRLLAEWLPDPCDRLILRIAVREIESWLMADRESLANFFVVSKAVIPPNPEAIPDPKQEIVKLARRAKRDIREDIVPDEDSTSKIGKNYNGCLAEFVEKYWSIAKARKRAPSLDKALKAISRFLRR